MYRIEQIALGTQGYQAFNRNQLSASVSFRTTKPKFFSRNKACQGLRGYRLQIQATNEGASIERSDEDIVEEVGRLRGVVEIAELLEGSRVLVVQCENCDIIQALQAEVEAEDITVTHTSQEVVEKVSSFLPPARVLGNESCVRVVPGDGTLLPVYYGPFQAVVFPDLFRGLTLEPRQAVIQAGLMLKPGGKLVLTQPKGEVMGAPNQAALQELIQGLPLQLVTMSEGDEPYFAVLQVPELYMLQGGVRFLKGEVEVGFGRGSKKMGVPTANIDPKENVDQLEELDKGVYFGWAKLEGDDGPAHKMVMNIGERPSFADGDGLTVEVHVMHDYGRDFHGERMRVVVVGHIRPEIRFSDIGSLVARIKTDVAIANTMLGCKFWSFYQDDTYFI